MDTGWWRESIDKNVFRTDLTYCELILKKKTLAIFLVHSHCFYLVVWGSSTGETPDVTEFTTVFSYITNNHSKMAGAGVRTHGWTSEYKGQKADSVSLKGWVSYTLKGRRTRAGSSFLLCGWLVYGQCSRPRLSETGWMKDGCKEHRQYFQHKPLAVFITTQTAWY